MSRSAALAGKILIADDNRVNRLLLGRGLEQRGTRSASRNTGERRSSMLRRTTSTWCCSTSSCPSWTATGSWRELQRDPHLRDIPVIVTSSLDEVDSVVTMPGDGRGGLLDQAR